MRTNRTNLRARRAGAAAVEFAFVALPLFMLMCGIFEYGRYLFVYHAAQNAARDGARFAAVHTSGGTMPWEPATITADDVKGVVQTGMFNGRAYGSGLFGVENQIDGYTCDVYALTNDQLGATPPDTDPAGKPIWNSAAFQDKVAVQISGTYRPVITNLIGLDSAISFKTTAMASSEGN
jgi:hypothetical protein